MAKKKSTGLWVVKSKNGFLSGVKMKTKKKEIVPSEMEIFYGSLDASPLPMMFKDSKEYADAWVLAIAPSGMKWEAYELSEEEVGRANKVYNP